MAITNSIPGINEKDLVSLGKRKRGDGFSYNLTFTDPDTTLPITGLAPRMKSQVKKIDKTGTEELLGTFTITESEDKPGTYNLLMGTSTQEWPLTTVYFDVEYKLTDVSLPESTPTFAVEIIRDITTYE